MLGGIGVKVKVGGHGVKVKVGGTGVKVEVGGRTGFVGVEVASSVGVSVAGSGGGPPPANS